MSRNKNNKRSINQLRAEADVADISAPNISAIKTKEQKHDYLTRHRGWIVVATLLSGLRYNSPSGQNGHWTLEAAWEKEMSMPEITKEMFRDNPDPFGVNPDDMRSIERGRRRNRHNNKKPATASVGA